MSQMVPTAARYVAALMMTGVVVASGAGSAAAEDPPSTTLTWSLVPASAAGEPDGRQSFRAVLDPGGTVMEHAVLTNYSDSTVTFDLTASDGVIAEDGSFDILQDDEAPQDSGTWIAVQDQVEVGPESSVLVPIQITVPDDAVPGDHPAGVTAGVSSRSQSAAGTDVGLQARVGVRLHLRVSGEISAALAVPTLSTRYDYSWNPFSPGRLVITYEVANAGNVRVGSTESVRTSGPFGVGASTTTAAQPREMLPRTSRTVTQVVDGVWPLARIGADLTAAPSAVGEDDLGSAALLAASATDTAWVIPWPQLALLCLLVVAVVLTRRVRRRRRVALAEALQRAREEGARAAASSSSSAGAR